MLISNPKYPPVPGYIEDEIDGQRVLIELNPGLTKEPDSDDPFLEIANAIRNAIDEL